MLNVLAGSVADPDVSEQLDTIIEQNNEILEGLQSIDYSLGVICVCLFIIMAWGLASRIIGAFFKS